MQAYCAIHEKFNDFARRIFQAIISVCFQQPLETHFKLFSRFQQPLEKNNFKDMQFLKTLQPKSRSDGTLLTVDDNLRTGNASCYQQSPAGTAQWEYNVSSLRDLAQCAPCFSFRRLKSTVNRVSSLRDCLIINEQ